MSKSTVFMVYGLQTVCPKFLAPNFFQISTLTPGRTVMSGRSCRAIAARPVASAPSGKRSPDEASSPRTKWRSWSNRPRPRTTAGSRCHPDSPSNTHGRERKRKCWMHEAPSPKRCGGASGRQRKRGERLRGSAISPVPDRTPLRTHDADCRGRLERAGRWSCWGVSDSVARRCSEVNNGGPRTPFIGWWPDRHSVWKRRTTP